MKHRLLTSVLLSSLFSPALAIAQQSDRPDGMRFVPDAQGQFLALTNRADAMGFHIGDSPNPSACKHYQAITRVDAANGVPFFLATRSGILPDTFDFSDILCDDSPGETDNGNLIIFKMGSRNRNGERLRSNRLRKGVHVDDTPPPAEDIATTFFTFVDHGLVSGNGDGRSTPRVYEHPGGMQLVGHMLAIAVEGRRDPLSRCIDDCLAHPTCVCGVTRTCGGLLCPPFGGDAGNRCTDDNDCATDCTSACEDTITYDRAPNPTLFMFFDVSNPEAPVFKSQYPPVDGNGVPLTKTGFVGVTPLPQVPGEAKGRYLAVTTGGEHPDHLFFYRSSPDDLSSEALAWEFLATSDYPAVADAHQTMQFLRERDIDGDLYLAGARGNANTVLHDDRDKIDLRLVVCTNPASGQPDPLCLPGDEISVAAVLPSREISPRPNTGGTRLVNLAAASGFYVSPTGDLLFYATEHDNDGPDDTVKVGEWRHINMARDSSPTFLPSVLLNEPFTVNEGGSDDLRGRAVPPIVQPWIELFNDTNFEEDNSNTLYPVVDYPDYALDDFDDFFSLETQVIPGNPPSIFRLNDRARSWKYFAPVGCSINVVNFENSQLQVRILQGTGHVEQDRDLSQSFPDMDRKVDAVEFAQNCDAYYSTDVALQWDLDRNGSYETTGNVVPFDATGLDGPAVISLPVQAQHPFGGPAGQTTALVTILNVPPSISPLVLRDSAGNEVNVDVPFVLTGLPVTASASFSDPGRLDHQTATLAWGDGVVDPNTVFALFDEAFGDGAGAVRHTHRFTHAGSFGVVLTVTDDDAGTDNESATVKVLTPEQAVKEILRLLDNIITSTTDGKVLKSLQKARKALAGSVVGVSANGALTMIHAGINPAAVAILLVEAINQLEAAEAGGANVATLIALLEQVAAALPQPGRAL